MAAEKTRRTFRVFAESESSEEFYYAFCHSSSSVISCEQCGRVHFNPHDPPGCFEEGELEKLMAKNEADPDAYFSHDCSVGWANSPNNGKQYVFGCPCHYDRALEDMLWGARHATMEYFMRRAKAEKKAADSMQLRATQASEAVKQT